MRASLVIYLWTAMALSAMSHKMKLDAGVAEFAARIELSNSIRFWDNRKFDVEMVELDARPKNVKVAANTP